MTLRYKIIPYATSPALVNEAGHWRQKTLIMRAISLVVPETSKIEPDLTVKKVFIRRNIWDNYGLFVGTRKVYDSGVKDYVIDYVAEKYPNATVIDNTSDDSGSIDAKPCQTEI